MILLYFGKPSFSLRVNSLVVQGLITFEANLANYVLGSSAVT